MLEFYLENNPFIDLYLHFFIDNLNHFVALLLLQQILSYILLLYGVNVFYYLRKKISACVANIPFWFRLNYENGISPRIGPHLLQNL